MILRERRYIGQVVVVVVVLQIHKEIVHHVHGGVATVETVALRLKAVGALAKPTAVSTEAALAAPSGRCCRTTESIRPTPGAAAHVSAAQAGGRAPGGR